MPLDKEKIIAQLQEMVANAKEPEFPDFLTRKNLGWLSKAVPGNSRNA